MIIFFPMRVSVIFQLNYNVHNMSSKSTYFLGGGVQILQALRYPKRNSVTYFMDCNGAKPGTFMDINITMNKYKPAMQYIHRA